MKAKITTLFTDRRYDGKSEVELTVVFVEAMSNDPRMDNFDGTILASMKSRVGTDWDTRVTRVVDSADIGDQPMTWANAIRWAVKTFDELVATHPVFGAEKEG